MLYIDFENYLSLPQDLRIQCILSNTIQTKTGCLEWQGATLRGYAVIGNIRLARYLYSKLVKEIPNNLHACHSCDNPKCINIDHIFIGTDADNMHDMTLKGRAKRGGKPQISDAVLNKILSMAKAGINHRLIAEEVGLSQVHVSRLCRKSNTGKRGPALFTQETISNILYNMKRGLTQQETADLLGISRSSVSRITLQHKEANL